MAPEDHAIVVGIRIYPGMSSLQGPCNDAEAFRAWLSRPDGGNVKAAKIRFLVTDQFPPPTGVANARPLADEIHALFRPLVSKGAIDGRQGRRLYIYMAGHGFSDPQDMDTAALYAANAQLTFPLHVAGTAYAEWFRRQATFDEIVLIMDCCRATTPMNEIVPPQLPTLSGSAQAKNVRTFYAYATCWSGVARERRFSGAVRGIFTHALLDAFDNALPGHAQRVTGTAISDYVHNSHYFVNPPDIKLNPIKDVVFAVRQRAATLQVRLRVNPFEGGEHVVVTDTDGTVVFEAGPLTTDTVTVDEPAGFYKAAVKGTSRSTLFEIPKDHETTV